VLLSECEQGIAALMMLNIMSACALSLPGAQYRRYLACDDRGEETADIITDVVGGPVLCRTPVPG
jgi:hypothetical protein